MKEKTIALFLVELLSRGYANNIEISISKIKNRIAIIKNWKENGRCLGFIVLNPHSNWDHFSFSEFSFLGINNRIVAKTNNKSSLNLHIIEILIIYLSV